MSEVIREFEGRKMNAIHFAHIVKSNDKYYYVSTAYTWDHGLETMVFPFDNDTNIVTDWEELYVEWYNSIKEANERHERICKNLEEYLNEEES